MTVVFSLIAVGVIIAILRTARRLRSLPWAITLGLLLGGATGNLGDRLFRSPGLLRGYVVDWIELPHWPVFNLADSCIVCGGILAVLLAARGISWKAAGTASAAGPGRPGPRSQPRPARRRPGRPSQRARGQQHVTTGGPAPGTGARGPGRRAAGRRPGPDVRPVPVQRGRPDQRRAGARRRPARGQVRPGARRGVAGRHAAAPARRGRPGAAARAGPGRGLRGRRHRGGRQATGRRRPPDARLDRPDGAGRAARRRAHRSPPAARPSGRASCTGWTRTPSG